MARLALLHVHWRHSGPWGSHVARGREGLSLPRYTFQCRSSPAAPPSARLPAEKPSIGSDQSTRRTTGPRQRLSSPATASVGRGVVRTIQLYTSEAATFPAASATSTLEEHGGTQDEASSACNTPPTGCPLVVHLAHVSTFTLTPSLPILCGCYEISVATTINTQLQLDAGRPRASGIGKTGIGAAA